MNVQLNVRIDEQLKRSGDEVFEGIGLTPSQVVRAVWEFAAAHRKEPDAVRESLGLPSSEFDQRIRDIEYDAAICTRLRDCFGLPAPDQLVQLNYRELREYSMRDRLGERALV